MGWEAGKILKDDIPFVKTNARTICADPGHDLAYNEREHLFAETWKGKELEALWHKAPWHFGPLRIQPALVLSNAGVDSNIYYSPGNPIKDYTLTAGPAVTAYLPIYRKLVLSGTASPQYVYYVKTEQERTWNYYLTGSAALA